MFVIIAARDENNGIGLDGKMPWYISDELSFFKKQTLYHSIVMGKRTYQGMGSPLPNRINYIVTRNPNIYDTQVLWITNLSRFIKTHANSDERIYICGGTQIYRQFLPYVDEMIISEVKGEYEVDTYFPEFNTSDFKKTLIKRHDQFLVFKYERVKSHAFQ